jgi:hypothetical protein
MHHMDRPMQAVSNLQAVKNHSPLPSVAANLDRADRQLTAVHEIISLIDAAINPPQPSPAGPLEPHMRGGGLGYMSMTVAEGLELAASRLSRVLESLNGSQG